jgi:hypothetical protein
MEEKEIGNIPDISKIDISKYVNLLSQEQDDPLSVIESDEGKKVTVHGVHI